MDVEALRTFVAVAENGQFQAAADELGISQQAASRGCAPPTPALRTLGDVPQALLGPLLGAVGCRMAFAGVTPWDGAPFAEVWGKEWVEQRM